MLERDPQRTLRAIEIRRRALDRGLDNLFRPSDVMKYEDSLDSARSRDLVRLSTEFFPEYLRWAEYVFGNLLELYWALEKRGEVDPIFRTKIGPC